MMQIRIFSVPILGGEALTEELNLFLRSKRILQVENHLTGQGQDAYWCFCIRYLEGGAEKMRTDYRQILDEAAFARFSVLRDIRKQIAAEEAIPAYAVFTDEELAAFARIEVLNLDVMKSVKGIGDKKVGKYGLRFINALSGDEKS